MRFAYWLIGISIAFVLLERLFPWRKGQKLFRSGWLRDVGFLAVNGHFFSLLSAGFTGWVALACRDLSDYINNQYLILFRSTHPPQRGVWRELRVEVGPRHERVRARSGYVR